MRLLADENVPGPSIRALREAGYDVEAVIEQTAGMPDADVLAYAREHQQILLTFDRDFGELIYRRGAAAPLGIIYMRLSPADPGEAADVLLELLGRADIRFDGRFSVIDRDRVRQRPLLNIS